MRIKQYATSKTSKTDIYFDIDYEYYKNLVRDRDFVIISDYKIFDLYPHFFKNNKYILINDGENNKTLNTINYIISKLLEFNIDRNSIIIGFGGGQICDIAGFSAHIYMRGTQFGFIPTTLLAQVDAAIGGKNGVNFENHKNLIGSFENPEFIILDTNLIKTLSEPEYKSGLGEILKYAIVCDNSYLIETIEKNIQRILNRDIDFLRDLIKDCAITKIGIIQQDPNDLSYRHILNFGHSIGHCIEISENLPHGIAIVKGMICAIDLSVIFEYLNIETANSIKNLFSKLNYDISYNITDEQIKILKTDKKKEKENLNFVFLRDINKPIITPVSISTLTKALNERCR